MKILNLNDSVKKDILNALKTRSHSGNDDFTKTVSDIIENVKANGDKAVFEYTKKFDGASVNKDNFIVSKEEIEEAYSLVSDRLCEIIRKSIANIKSFHEKQLRQSWFSTENMISRTDGMVLLFLLLFYLFIQAYFSKKSIEQKESGEISYLPENTRSIKKSIIVFVIIFLLIYTGVALLFSGFSYITWKLHQSFYLVNSL